MPPAGRWNLPPMVCSKWLSRQAVTTTSALKWRAWWGIQKLLLIPPVSPCTYQPPHRTLGGSDGIRNGFRRFLCDGLLRLAALVTDCTAEVHRIFARGRAYGFLSRRAQHEGSCHRFSGAYPGGPVSGIAAELFRSAAGSAGGARSGASRRRRIRTKRR